MTAEEFIKENETHFARICYERTAEEQSDDFINKVGMVCHLLEAYAKHENEAKDKQIKELKELLYYCYNYEYLNGEENREKIKQALKE